MVTPLHIIVIEDHDALRDMTVAALRTHGHQVQGASCAESLVEMAAFSTADLLVLDINLPGEDGLSLASRLRRSHPHLGIILLTGRSSLDQKVQGYDSGADIYLTKPTSMEALRAAIGALSRRLKPLPLQAHWRLDLQQRKLVSDAGAVVLSEPEVKLLYALACAPERKLEHWQLMELLALQDQKNALEAHIARLRKKLMQLGADAGVVKVVRQVGYQLRDPVRVV
jgi:DNA-binding response OmpR family regulator